MRALLLATSLTACGGKARPAPPRPPTFDARQLASRLDGIMREIETVTRTYEHDCPRMVSELAHVEDRARAPIDEARAARQDPERARALTLELRAYNDAATGRSDVIALRLAICWKQHGELHDQVQRVVDSLPTP
jgi:hypothetical protein